MSPSQSMQATASTDEEPIRYPVPPFTEETARQKVKAAQVSILTAVVLDLLLGGRRVDEF